MLNEIFHGLFALVLFLLSIGMFIVIMVAKEFMNPTPPTPREHSGRSDAQQEADQAASLQWWGDLCTGRWDSEDK